MNSECNAAHKWRQSYDFMQCHCVALLLDTVGTSLLRTSPEAVLLFRPKEVAKSEQALEPFVA